MEKHDGRSAAVSAFHDMDGQVIHEHLAVIQSDPCSVRIYAHGAWLVADSPILTRVTLRFRSCSMARLALADAGATCIKPPLTTSARNARLGRLRGAYLHAQHRYGPSIDPFNRKRDCIFWLCCAEHVQEG